MGNDGWRIDRMKKLWSFLTLLLCEITLLVFIIFVISLNGVFLLNYFTDAIPFIGIVGGVLITLLSSGQLMDFGKSFVLAIRTEIEASEGQRACLALQCAMFAAFIWSILICIVGVVAAQNGLFLEPMEDFAVANINALCAAQPCVGVLIVLLLCPLYFRIKRRMIT